MSKITLDPLAGTFAAVTALNEKFQAIEDAFNDRVLYRDNIDGEPNEMNDDLDMNAQRIINLPSATSVTEPATYGQLLDAASGITSITTLSEEQTASSDGQSLFTFTSITYTPGAKNLTVYRNGTKLPISSYTETSTSSITLSAANAAAVKSGDEFEFIVNQRDVDSDTYLASNVTYTPAGSGATTSDVQTKLRDFRTIEDFGGVGDGTTDARAALALYDAASSEDIHLGVANSNARIYRISSNITVSNNIHFHNGAQLSVDTGVVVTLNGMIFAGDTRDPFTGAGRIIRSNVELIVPDDYTKIQDAIDAVPKALHQYIKIRIKDGTYNEDLRVDGFRSATMTDSVTAEETGRLWIEGFNGVSQDPDVDIDSIVCSNCSGQQVPLIQNLTINATQPFTDEESSCEFNSCYGASVSDVSFAGVGVTNCIFAFRSFISVENIDFGSSVNNTAFKTKTGSWIDDNGGHSGTVIDTVFNAGSGFITTLDAAAVDYTNGPPVSTRNEQATSTGVVIDVKSGQIWGVTTTGSSESFEYQSVFESLDGYHDNSTSTGSFSLATFNGGVTLSTGATSGSNAEIFLDREIYTGGLDWSKAHTFSVGTSIDSVTDCTSYIGIGDPASDFVGFKIVNNVLNGCVVVSAIETLTSLETGIGAGSNRRLHVKHYPGSKTEFYSNGLFKGVTSSSPSVGSTRRMFFARTTNSAASDKTLKIGSFKTTTGDI